MALEGKKVTDLKKHFKDQKNEMTRSKICEIQSLKKSMLIEELDNKLVHELCCEKGLQSPLKHVSGHSLKHEINGVIRPRRNSYSKSSESKNKCENTSHGWDADNKPNKPALILRILHTFDETEVKEVRARVSYQSETHDEKCDPDKSVYEEHIEELNTTIQDEDKTENFSKSLLTTDIDSVQNIDLHSTESWTDVPDAHENFALNTNVEKDNHSSTNSEICTRESAIAEESLVWIDEEEEEESEDISIKIEPAEKRPVLETAYESAESLDASGDKSACKMGCLTMNNASLLECVAVWENPLENHDETVEDVNCCTSLLHLKQEVEFEFQHTVSSVETRNKLSADVLSIERSFGSSLNEARIKMNVYQIMCLESSDMNESYHEFFLWQHQRLETVACNLKDARDPIKFDNLLKKMPLSMDNRIFPPCDVQEKCSNKMKNNQHTRKHHNKKEKADRSRKKQKLINSKYVKKFRKGRGHSQHIWPTSVFMQGTGSNLSKNKTEKTSGAPGNKTILPGKDNIDPCSYSRSPRTCVNGHSNQGGSRSYNDSSSGQAGQRGGRKGGNGKAGHRSGNGNSGSGDGNGDDKDEKRRFSIKPNITKEEEEENSDEENGQGVDEENGQGVKQDGREIFDGPRPPEVNGLNQTIATIRQAETEHSSLTSEQLWYLLGTIPTGPLANIFDGQGHALNVCFTRMMHQLQLADQLDQCSVCLILGGFFQHLTMPDHSDVHCAMCQHICMMVFYHTELCIVQLPPPTHRTSTDLCYKICQKADWNVGMLKYDHDFVKMVFEYCCNILKLPPLQIGETNEQAMAPSTSAMANYDSGDTNRMIPTLAGAFANDDGSNAVGSTSTAPRQSSPGAMGHSQLTRKPSNQRPPVSIPPSIVEEKSDDESPHEDVPPDPAFLPPAADLSARPKTGRRHLRGEATGYVESMPEGTVHDVTQFPSFVDQPTGTRGIGEVAFADSRRLCLVARHWKAKREECERTEQRPVQLREEGVILEKYKSLFTILGTRYQQGTQWEVQTPLGYGMHGRCFLASDLESRHKFCVKKIELLKYEANELLLWADLDSPYIVKLYGAIRHGDTVYILSELIDGGDLASVINHQRDIGQRLSHWTAINCFQQLLRALEYLHCQHILHEDIKAENILMRGNSPQILVTDFGISRRLQGEGVKKNEWPLGTATHFSPEKAASMGHGYPADVWAAVCVLVYMMSGKLPWHKYLKKADTLSFIIYFKPPPMDDLPYNIQEVVRDLIVQGFNKEPELRPSASELLRHPAFQILFGDTPESYYSILKSGLNSVGGAHASIMKSGLNSVGGMHASTLKSGLNSVGGSHASTLRSGLNSIGGSHAKAVEKKIVVAQPAQKEDEASSAQQSVDSDAVLYSLSIHSKDSTPHLPIRVDDVVEIEDTGPPMAVVKPTSPSCSLSGPVPVQTAGTEHPERDSLTNLNEEEDRRESASTSLHTPVACSPAIGMIPNLDALLPSLPIRDFITDTYDSSQVFVESSRQHSILQVYEPYQASGSELPNLSIFDGSFDTRSTSGEHMPLPNFGYRRVESPTDPESRREDLPILTPENLSSCDLSSSERVPSGPQAMMAPHVRVSTSEVTIAHEVNLLSTASSKPSNRTLMRKKPVNLSLNVSGVDERDAHGGLREEKSSYDVASSSSYTSSHSSHSKHRDLHAEQEKLLKDMMSSHSSENGNFFGNNDNGSDVEDAEDSPPIGKESDLDSSQLTDETPLEGKKISFYNENNEWMFSYRFLSTPVRLYTHIREIKRIYQLGLHHFELRHMDDSGVSYSSEFVSDKLKIVVVASPTGQLCTCTGCLYMTGR